MTLPASSLLPSVTRMGRCLVVGALVLGAAGCIRKPVETYAQIPDDFTERHPIVLGDVPAKLEVFLANNSGLDHRQSGDVKAFVQQYLKDGKGPLVATLPAGAPGGSVQFTLGQIRKVAGAAGLRAGALRVSPGGETHPTAASIRLSFNKLDAKVVSRCGQWPDDLAGGATLKGWENRPYYNLGCSYQTMMAAQVANPIDMLRGRPESEIDIQKRLGDFKSVRENADPTTKWPADQTKINSAL
jgi:pilus assembly protein CpaD